MYNPPPQTAPSTVLGPDWSLTKYVGKQLDSHFLKLKVPGRSLRAKE